MVTTANIEKVYSPAEDLANPTGVNAAAVMSVPVSIGNAVEVYAKAAAFARFLEPGQAVRTARPDAEHGLPYLTDRTRTGKQSHEGERVG